MNVVYAYNGVLFNNKTKCSTDMRYHIDEHENIMLSARRQEQKCAFVWFHLYKTSRVGKHIESESRLVLSQGWEMGGRGRGGLGPIKQGFSFGWWKRFSSWLCRCFCDCLNTWKGIQWVNCMVCEFYFHMNTWISKPAFLKKSLEERKKPYTTPLNKT